jgi:hypothetical protein
METNLTLDFPEDFVIACTISNVRPEEFLQEFINNISLTNYTIEVDDDDSACVAATCYLLDKTPNNRSQNATQEYIYIYYSRLLELWAEETRYLLATQKSREVYATLYRQWYEALINKERFQVFPEPAEKGTLLGQVRHIEISGSIKVIIEQADHEELIICGAHYSPSDIVWRQENGYLKIVYIGTEEFDSVKIIDNGSVLVEGDILRPVPVGAVRLLVKDLTSITLFKNIDLYSYGAISSDILHLSAYGDCHMMIAIKVNYLDCIIKDRAAMALYGSAVNENLLINGSGNYNSQFRTQTTNVHISDNGKASVTTKKQLTAVLKDNARLICKDEPEIEKISCSGKSQVIRGH